MRMSPEAYVILPGTSGTTGVSIWQDRDLLHAQCTRCGSDIYWNPSREQWYCSAGSECEVGFFTAVPKGAGMSMTSIHSSKEHLNAWVAIWSGIPEHQLTVEVGATK